MESLSFGKMNFRRSGKSLGSEKFPPRHSAGISRHASAKVLPANGPLATRQFTSVSQASPIGSSRFAFSGYSGASERDPQIRGLKVGSIRNGSGAGSSLGAVGPGFGI